MTTGCRDYEDGMEELEPISVLDVVMALQRQGAIGQYRNSRSACPCFLLKLDLTDMFLRIHIPKHAPASFIG